MATFERLQLDGMDALTVDTVTRLMLEDLVVDVAANGAALTADDVAAMRLTKNVLEEYRADRRMERVEIAVPGMVEEIAGETAPDPAIEIIIGAHDTDAHADAGSTADSDGARYGSDTETVDEPGEDKVEEPGEALIVEPQRPRVPLTDCTRCYDTLPRDNAYRSPCGCFYCHGCVNWLFRQSMTDLQLYPPRCCHRPMPVDDVLPLLFNNLAEEFQNKQEELDDQNKAYCHVPTCSTYIPVSNRKDDVAHCSLCHAKTCLRCHGPGHIGGCPTDEDVQAILAMGELHGWQRCGDGKKEGCAQMVSISDGCNHMTCLCGYDFCLVCGKKWKTCDCSQLGQAAEVARREFACARHWFNRTTAGVLGVLHCQFCDFAAEGDTWLHRCENCRLQVCQNCRRRVVEGRQD